MLGQGSSNTAFTAGTMHVAWPTQAADTILQAAQHVAYARSGIQTRHSAQHARVTTAAGSPVLVAHQQQLVTTCQQQLLQEECQLPAHR